MAGESIEIVSDPENCAPAHFVAKWWCFPRAERAWQEQSGDICDVLTKVGASPWRIHAAAEAHDPAKGHVSGEDNR